MRGKFDIACSLKQPDALSLATRIQGYAIGEQNFSWDIDFKTELRQVESLGLSSYGDFSEALALWDASTGKLEIGFFPQATSVPEKRQLKRAGSIRALANKKPDMVVTIPLPLDSQKVSFDLIRRGYTISFTRREGGQITFPGEKSSLDIKFSPGKRPKRVDGRFIEGRRIIGRFQGNHVEQFPEGKLMLRWAAPFNAVVLIVGK